MSNVTRVLVALTFLVALTPLQASAEDFTIADTYRCGVTRINYSVTGEDPHDGMGCDGRGIKAQLVFGMGCSLPYSVHVDATGKMSSKLSISLTCDGSSSSHGTIHTVTLQCVANNPKRRDQIASTYHIQYAEIGQVNYSLKCPGGYSVQ